jgi:hypothetical protein
MLLFCNKKILLHVVSRQAKDYLFFECLRGTACAQKLRKGYLLISLTTLGGKK